MKKIFLLIIAVFICQLNSAQTIILEDFTGTAWPPEGWSFEGQHLNWLRSGTSNAGGEAPEARFRRVPLFSGNSRMVSPELNLTGVEYIQIRFKHNVDFNTGNFTIGVSTRSGGTSGTWNNVWTQPVTFHVPATEIELLVSNADIGASDFQIGFFFQGNSANINSWFIDDVEVIEFIPLNLDAGLTAIDVPDLVIGQHQVTGTAMNYGSTAINALEISWQLNDGLVHTTNFTGLNLTTSMEYDFVSDQPINVDPGNYLLKVWVSGVNGQAGDDNPDNDMLQKNISVLDEPIQRVPMFEEFTSSTCPPCATFNNTVMNPFFNQYQHDITLVKYQMNWPGAGDPYYTAEGGVRRSYYGVNAVPSMFIEGANVATNWTAVFNAYQNAMNQQAFMEISAQHIIEGDDITVNAIIKPYVNATNVRVHIVVIEQTTYGNVGTNGETSFKHVMMKMLPNANGTAANLSVGSHFVLNYSHDMSGTFVEDMDDLRVVVFVQAGDKSIFQSAYTERVSSFVVPGDANCDELINVQDIVVTIQYITGSNPQPFCFDNADVNADGFINVQDVVGIVNIVLGGSKSANQPVRSLPANIYIHDQGIAFESDGTIAGLQFEITGIQVDDLQFMLPGHELALAKQGDVLTGIVFSFDNTPIPPGKIELFRFNRENQKPGFGQVLAANLNANGVKVFKHNNESEFRLNESYDLTLFPNPAGKGFSLDITLPHHAMATLKLIDITGRELKTIHHGILNAGENRIEVLRPAGLENGVYFLQVQAEASGADQAIFIRNHKIVFID
jgi:hypothetical protein